MKIILTGLVFVNIVMGGSIAAETKDKSMATLKTASEIAKKSTRPAGAPEYADVCFRYGWIRNSGEASVENAKKAISEFHATRVDWFYPGSHTADPKAEYVTKESKKFIDWCHSKGMKVGGAMSTLTAHKAWDAGAGHNSGRFRGKPDNPEYIAAAVAWGKAQIDAGVDTLVCDDFFGYRSGVMKQQFSDNVIKPIKAHKKGFMIAGNCGNFIDTRYVKNYAFDFHYSDSNFAPKPGHWLSASKAHRALNSAFLLHPNKHMTKEVRRGQISLGYATGSHLITPWDEYIHGKGKKRLFADPADFADLYGFARALGQQGYLNGYEDAVVGGYDLKETRYGTIQPINLIGGSGNMSVFGRAKPGEKDAPVVLHMVEWEKPNPFKIKLHRESFFKSGEIVLSLRVPTPYDEKIHNKAEESKDYSQLSKEIPIKTKEEGDWIVAEIPALTPSGILVVSKEK